MSATPRSVLIAGRLEGLCDLAGAVLALITVGGIIGTVALAANKVTTPGFDFTDGTSSAPTTTHPYVAVAVGLGFATLVAATFGFLLVEYVRLRARAHLEDRGAKSATKTPAKKKTTAKESSSFMDGLTATQAAFLNTERPPGGTEATWLTDPFDDKRLRWWDGQDWTGHTSDDPVEAKKR